MRIKFNLTSSSGCSDRVEINSTNLQLLIKREANFFYKQTCILLSGSRGTEDISAVVNLAVEYKNQLHKKNFILAVAYFIFIEPFHGTLFISFLF